MALGEGACPANLRAVLEIQFQLRRASDALRFKPNVPLENKGLCVHPHFTASNRGPAMDSEDGLRTSSTSCQDDGSRNVDITVAHHAEENNGIGDPRELALFSIP